MSKFEGHGKRIKHCFLSKFSLNSSVNLSESKAFLKDRIEIRPPKDFRKASFMKCLSNFNKDFDRGKSS